MNLSFQFKKEPLAVKHLTQTLDCKQKKNRFDWGKEPSELLWLYFRLAWQGMFY